MRGVAIGGAVAAIVAGAIGVAVATQSDNAVEPATEPTRPAASPQAGVEEIDSPTEAEGGALAGTTPMAEREAVIGLLNKRNGIARDLTLKPGQATRIGDAVVRLSACEKTAPWEPEQLTGAFVQLDVRGPDGNWRRTFSGWLYAERPSFNVVLHPIYDVWPKSCKMSFPDKGPDTLVVGGNASSAVKSPRRSGGSAAGDSEPAESTPSADDSAPSSNAI